MNLCQACSRQLCGQPCKTAAQFTASCHDLTHGSPLSYEGEGWLTELFEYFFSRADARMPPMVTPPQEAAQIFADWLIERVSEAPPAEEVIFGHRVDGGDWFGQHRGQAKELRRQLVARRTLAEIEAKQRRPRPRSGPGPGPGSASGTGTARTSTLIPSLLSNSEPGPPPAPIVASNSVPGGA